MSTNGSNDPALPTEMITVVLGDVEGSTRRWATARDVMAAAIEALDELVSECVKNHRGTRPIEQGEGDSFVAIFARPTDALGCVLALQRALECDDLGLRLRIGIHSGEVEVTADGRYMGTTFNRCARLRDLASGGQTLLSLSTYAMVSDRLPADVWLEDLGSHELRDLAQPERVYQLCHPDLPRGFPPLTSAAPPRHNLPASLTSFVGRAPELAELSRLVAETRALTLTGAGGCGKTRLALRLAADLVHEFGDGVWWVDLAPLADPELVPSAVAAAVGVREVPNEDLVVTLSRQLRARRVLVLLDNCEHLVEACASVAERLLGACPSLSILATSREPLGVASETAWRVPSLPVPPVGPETAIGESLERFDAVRLFVERAARVRPNFKLTLENAFDVAIVCSRLDGIPLAIELAAAQIRMLSPRQIADELAGSFRLLTGGQRNALPRQRTLEASVDWSYNLLGPEERTLIARLSVFAGGFTLEAAEAVCAGEGIDSYEVFDVLARLVDKSLVQVEQDTGCRYRLLESIRYFAQRRLVDSGDASAVRDRHLDFYLALAEAAKPALLSAEVAQAVARLAVETDNVRAALDWGIQSGDGDRAGRLVGALSRYWTACGYFSEGLGWAHATLSLGCAAPVARFDALEAAAALQEFLGDMVAARPHAEEAVAIARQLDDRRRLGAALQTLGFPLVYIDRSSARPVLEEGIRIQREEGDDCILTSALYTVGILEATEGELVSARRATEEAVQLARRAGRPELPAALYIHGWVARLQGELAEAEAALCECVEAATATSDPFWSSLATELLGDIARCRGDLDMAHSQLTGALAAGRDTGSAWAVTYATWHLGHLAYDRGDLVAATTLLGDATALLHQVATEWGAVLTRLILGDIAQARHDRAGAIHIWEEALALAGATGNRYVIGRAQQRMARVARWNDDLRRAEDLVHQALGGYIEVGDRLGVIDALEDLGMLAADHDSWAEATRLLGAASAAREATLYARPPIGAAAYNQALAELLDHLGEVEFAATWADGRAMSTAAAVAYAQKRRGTRKRPSAGWASLTPTELQVAALATEGLSNPAIAERMFITRGTVKVHLSHIFAKLGIANRTELAAVVTRRSGQPDG